MARVLLTGMSGAGKSTLLRALAARGHRTVDTDYDGWTLPDGRWDEPRMHTLLAANPTIAASGTVQHQGPFYDSSDDANARLAASGRSTDAERAQSAAAPT